VQACLLLDAHAGRIILVLAFQGSNKSKKAKDKEKYCSEKVKPDVFLCCHLFRQCSLPESIKEDAIKKHYKRCKKDEHSKDAKPPQGASENPTIFTTQAYSANGTCNAV